MPRQKRISPKRPPERVAPAGFGALDFESAPWVNLGKGWNHGFQHAFDQAAIGMALVGLDGAWLRVNSALCRILGYSAEDLTATNFQHLTPADDLPVDLERLGQMLRGEIPSCQMEKRYIRRDGTLVWALLNVSLIRESNGQPIFFFSQVQDISERKRAEEALRESESRFQAFLDNSPNLIFIKDPQGRYLLVNKEFERVLARKEEAILGRGDEQLFPPEQAAAFRANDRRVLETGKATEFEEAALHADGPHTSIVHKFPLFAADGRICALGGVATDISARKRAEEVVRRREEEHRRLIENVPEVVWKADPLGNAFFISEKIEDLFGYTAQEVYEGGARLWFARMHEEDRERVAEAYAKLFSESQPFDVEYRIQHRDGRWMWWHDRANSFASDGGGSHAEGLLSDITERKHTQQQLLQRHKMEAIGQLAGGLAHDFNNLLTVIKGNNDMLSESLEPGTPARRGAEQVGKAADRAASLTRQLLAFSRMQVLQPQVLDLNALISELGTMLPRLLGEDVEFVVATDPHLGRVKADEVQLEQVLVNLAANARDAMPHGGKLVIETKNVALDAETARVHQTAPAGLYVLLTVSDTGQGMDKETQSHIFEPFFTTKKQGKGTGLGLATVYGIVKQSRGFIWVYSEPGQGTTFKIYLPRVEEPLETAEHHRNRAPKLRGSETVLLVEDEEAVRELVGGFLRTNGYAVLEATNGFEGLRLAARHGGNIDLLLTDLIMPKMGGWELADRLAGERPDLKVIYMSGYSEYVAAPGAKREHRGAFLQKPFSMQELGGRIREALDKRSAP